MPRRRLVAEPPFMSSLLRRLVGEYGPRPLRTWGKAVPVLVETILSQNTSNKNSGAGFRILRRTFKTWDAVADAPVEDVERAIRISGLSNTKAPRIQSILRQIRRQRGRISLEFLRTWEPRAALDYLLGFHGVGPKTAHCTLLFAFGMPLFPVDTHIHRIAIRMGLIPRKATLEQAHDLLADAIRPAERYPLHILLIAHGRTVCKPANPRCRECVLAGDCDYGKVRLAVLDGKECERPAPCRAAPVKVRLARSPAPWRHHSPERPTPGRARTPVGPPPAPAPRPPGPRA